MQNRIERSFSAKLSFCVISSITLLSIIGFSIFRQYANHSLEHNVHEKVRYIAEKADLQITTLLRGVEKIPENMQWIIGDYTDTPDSLFSITRKIVRNNPEIYGCAIAFEPYYFSCKGRYFAPYSYMSGDSVITTQVGSDDYDYFRKNWYRLAREQKFPRWSRPYRNFGANHTVTLSYSVPFKDENQQIIGVFSVDLSTDWLADIANTIRPYKNSYAIIVDKQGNNIVHRKEKKLPEKNIFTTTGKTNNTTAVWLTNEMTNGKTGRIVLDDNGVKSYVFYIPITATDWYMCVVCPNEEVFRQLNNFNRVVIILFVIVMILIYIVCSMTVKTLTRPLHNFAIYARTIANGGFKTPLPPIKSKDEMKELYDSFRYMQQQLKTYIDTLQKTSAAKETIDNELRIAHDIQMGMLPKTFPPFPNRKEIDLYAVLNPAKQVGGDLYDFFIIENNLYFAIGDVSGKGVPASLLMSGTISLLRSISSRHIFPRTITQVLNNNLADANHADMFVTFFIGMLDIQTGTLRYCNAGHVPPILTSPTREVSFLDIIPSPPLGISRDYKYKEQSYALSPGSGLLLYTDGVTDTENCEKGFYTQKRLLNIVQNNNNLNPKQFIETIMNDINDFACDELQTDDLTLLTLVFGAVWNEKKSSEK